jgi:hypothetical protein
MYGFIRNVHWLSTGCLQSQTPFLTAQGTEVINAFCIVTICLDDKGSIAKLLPDYHYFYIPNKNDYPHFKFQREFPDNEIKLNGW